MVSSHEIVGDLPVEVLATGGRGGVALWLSGGDDGRVPEALAACGVTGVKVTRPADFWVTPAGESWVAETLFPWAIARWGVSHVALAGHGVAGHAALRLAFRQAGRFPVIAADSAAVDLHDYYGSGTPLDDHYDSREACRQDSALLAVRPFRTPPHVAFACRPTHPHFRGNDRLHEKLNAVGVAHAFLTDGDFAGGLSAFVTAALSQQARRLV